MACNGETADVAFRCIKAHFLVRLIYLSRYGSEHLSVIARIILEGSTLCRRLFQSNEQRGYNTARTLTFINNIIA